MAANEVSRRDVLLLASLFVVEVSTAVVMTALHMKGARPFDVFLSSRPGLAFGCALATLFIGGTLVLRRYLTHKRSPSRSFRLIVTMHLITVVVILVLSELAVRAVVRHDLGYEKVGNTVLKPRDWELTKRDYRPFVEKSRSDRAFFVHDDHMGWTLGVNRYSFDKGEGPYWSSKEKIRAADQDVSYVKLKRKTDIAIIGDSFAFGDEVIFQETWGDKVDQMLGDDYRVLNFGVPGYSLGQAYLRYETEVVKWKPKVVIFGFIDYDLTRTMWVYPFVSSGWGLPFSKSRFVLRDGEIKNINPNPLSPEEIFSAPRISTLPSIKYDIGYRPGDWQKRWYHASYLVRLITSLFPAWSAPGANFSEEAILSTNIEILRTFIRSAEEAGSIPLVVWFPSRTDLQSLSTPLSLGKRMLDQASIPYIDPSPCLLELDPAVRFLDSHYSPQGNTAVANCVYETIETVLAQVSGRVQK
ncbi:MAG: SGNH/GDSL hydrolase family protein [Nitrospira sp. BO4]|jgi:hypothetical protein|nr:SGNH/GDSL hydrolase family protein [Nitrospira sp. BO4]